MTFTSRNTGPFFVRTSFTRSATSLASRTVVASGMPQPRAIMARSVPAPESVGPLLRGLVWVAWLPVSPNFSLSSTTIARFSGICVATVAREPRLISMSPSPVMTSTRFVGCAKARPRPMPTGAPIEPQSGMLSGRSPAAVMSQLDEPRPAITSRLSSAPSRSCLTSGRRCSVAPDLLGLILLLPEILDADQLLAQQHGDGLAAVEGRARGGVDRGLHLVGRLDRVEQYAHRLEHLRRALAHRVLP